jgi:hypothetical protein
MRLKEDHPRNAANQAVQKWEHGVAQHRYGENEFVAALSGHLAQIPETGHSERT